MSNLGGNSPSADTDKSNNLVGTPGTNGTNGTNGNDGVVQTVVGGTNTTVDSSDPANPIINVSASGGQNTTKGDVEGYDTGAARIPVGDNDQVLTADSTTALGVAWKTPAAAVPLLFTFNSLDPGNVVASGSSNATKGQWIDIGSNNITVFNIQVGARFSTAQTYRMFIAKEAATANEVESIIAVSETVAMNSSPMAVSGFCAFTFTAAFELLAGERYFIGVQRIDGTSTSACNIILNNGPPFNGTDIKPAGFVTEALDTIPAPGYDLGNAGNTFNMAISVLYIRS